MIEGLDLTKKKLIYVNSYMNRSTKNVLCSIWWEGSSRKTGKCKTAKGEGKEEKQEEEGKKCKKEQTKKKKSKKKNEDKNTDKNRKKRKAKE